MIIRKSNCFFSLLICFGFHYSCAAPQHKEIRTLSEALNDIGPSRENRLKFRFKKNHVPFPPAEMALLAFKKEKRLEMWGRGNEESFRHIRNYRVLGASGLAGPKLTEGDRQVPEGVYRIAYLNPNSSYHLSMKINYPNHFDRQKAILDGRRKLGGDIFFHGKRGSSGCLAMGDAGIESLFTAVAKTGVQNVRVVIAPNDLRNKAPAFSERSQKIPWTEELYEMLEKELSVFR